MNPWEGILLAGSFFLLWGLQTNSLSLIKEAPIRRKEERQQ
jgi:hypothetical protein